MNATLKIAAVAGLAVALGIGVVQLRPSTNNVSSGPSPSPSPSPLVWTPASIEQDWPAPVRDEPVGDPVVIQVADGYLDPRGDIESPDMPWIEPGDTTVRVWRTDLHAGTTEVGPSGASACDCIYPGAPADMTDGASASPPPETVEYRGQARFNHFEIPTRFYVWASVIQDGQVVATDYAPDTGWLEPPVKPEPSGSSAP